VQVVPKIQPIGRIDFSNDAVLEALNANKSALADSLDYAYVRNYVPGDPLKTIHWKLSARTENYMTRLFEVYTNPGVSIILDFYGPSDSASTLMGMFDAVVETAFSVGEYARLQGMDTELHFRNRHSEDTRVAGWRRETVPDVVADMPGFSNEDGAQLAALELIQSQTASQYGQNNLVVCTANLSPVMVSSVIEAKIRRRSPMVFAVVPSDLIGREREDYCVHLKRLDAAGIGYRILAKSDELVGAGAI
jgi:uncharacterized protein (DUF58 family)